MKLNKKALEWAWYWVSMYQCEIECPSGNCNYCKQHQSAQKELERLLK
jgi:hypothetical protein